MTKRANVILSLLNVSTKNQHYNPIRTLDDIKEVFKNGTIDFDISERKYTLIYNCKKTEILLKEKNQANKTIMTFNKSTSLEQIIYVFGIL